MFVSSVVELFRAFVTSAQATPPSQAAAGSGEINAGIILPA
jgi:hypothetical protein